MNNLLKLALIISIFFSVANSVSAGEENSSQQNAVDNKKEGTSVQSTQQEKNDNSKSGDKQLQQNQQDKNNPKAKTKNESQNNQPSKVEKILQPPNSAETNNQKTLTITDLFLYIDLPISTTLLLLWFFSQNKQQKQIKELAKNQNKIISKFNQLNELDNKLNNLDRINRQIIEKITDSEVRLSELLSKQQVKHLVNNHNNIGLHSDRSPPEQLHYQSDKSNLNLITVINNIPQFVEIYNRNKYFISDEVIATVAETQESLNQKHLDNSNTITLENTTKKKYWIIEEDDVYYLIPHAKIKIDEYNIKSFESIFECISFHPEYSDFKLVKPAIVFNDDDRAWKLERKGRIEFI